MLHPHARALVEAVPPPEPGAGRVVLDVAAGAGTLLDALRVMAGPAGRVVALDRSRGMLLRASADVARIQADAAALPVADASADVVVLAFVLFMLPDARRAAAQAVRVLRPGGWLLAATWGDQIDTGADTVLVEELDRAGAPQFPALPRSDELTDSPRRMATLLAEAGLTDVRTEVRLLRATLDVESVLAIRTRTGTPGWRFSQLAAAEQASVLQRGGARLAELPLSEFVDDSQVLLTWGRRG